MAGIDPYTSAEFLAQKTVVELRVIAKEYSVTGYSRMSKAELVDEIDHARADIIEYEPEPVTGEQNAKRESQRRQQDSWGWQADQERPAQGQVRQKVGQEEQIDA